jgi:hypothetical protein
MTSTNKYNICTSYLTQIWGYLRVNLLFFTVDQRGKKSCQSHALIFMSLFLKTKERGMYYFSLRVHGYMTVDSNTALVNVVIRNICLRDLRWLFFFLVTGNRDRKFRYCSRIYVWNWFTLLNEQNPLLDLFWPFSKEILLKLLKDLIFQFLILFVLASENLVGTFILYCEVCTYVCVSLHAQGQNKKIVCFPQPTDS